MADATHKGTAEGAHRGTGASARRRRLPRWADRLVTLLIILVGAGLLVWPWLADWLDARGTASQISQVSQNIDALDPEERARYLAQARAYNAVLAGDDDALATMGIADGGVWPYEEQLTYQHDPMMSWVEVPSVDISLPIYHGTSDDALAAGVGHLEGTSLPVGGASTHCVLTAHSGLRASRMFDDIRLLEEGDLVLLHTMGETLAYRVTGTETVLPTQMESLAIRDGEDLLTLLTCTPYGVNTHRLLVHCERCDYTEEVAQEAGAQAGVAGRHWGVRELAVAVVVVALVVVAIDVTVHRHGRRESGRPRHLAAGRPK